MESNNSLTPCPERTSGTMTEDEQKNNKDQTVQDLVIEHCQPPLFGSKSSIIEEVLEAQPDYYVNSHLTDKTPQASGDEIGGFIHTVEIPSESKEESVLSDGEQFWHALWSEKDRLYLVRNYPTYFASYWKETLLQERACVFLLEGHAVRRAVTAALDLGLSAGASQVPEAIIQLNCVINSTGIIQSRGGSTNVRLIANNGKRTVVWARREEDVDRVIVKADKRIRDHLMEKALSLYTQEKTKVGMIQLRGETVDSVYAEVVSGDDSVTVHVDQSLQRVPESKPTIESREAREPITKEATDASRVNAERSSALADVTLTEVSNEVKEKIEGESNPTGNTCAANTHVYICSPVYNAASGFMPSSPGVSVKLIEKAVALYKCQELWEDGDGIEAKLEPNSADGVCLQGNEEKTNEEEEPQAAITNSSPHEDCSVLAPSSGPTKNVVEGSQPSCGAGTLQKLRELDCNFDGSTANKASDSSLGERDDAVRPPNDSAGFQASLLDMENALEISEKLAVEKEVVVREETKNEKTEVFTQKDGIAEVKNEVATEEKRHVVATKEENKIDVKEEKEAVDVVEEVKNQQVEDFTGEVKENIAEEKTSAAVATVGELETRVVGDNMKIQQDPANVQLDIDKKACEKDSEASPPGTAEKTATPLDFSCPEGIAEAINQGVCSSNVSDKIGQFSEAAGKSCGNVLEQVDELNCNLDTEEEKTKLSSPHASEEKKIESTARGMNQSLNDTEANPKANVEKEGVASKQTKEEDNATAESVSTEIKTKVTPVEPESPSCAILDANLDSVVLNSSIEAKNDEDNESPQAGTTDQQEQGKDQEATSFTQELAAAFDRHVFSWYPSYSARDGLSLEAAGKSCGEVFEQLNELDCNLIHEPEKPAEGTMAAGELQPTGTATVSSKSGTEALLAEATENKEPVTDPEDNEVPAYSAERTIGTNLDQVISNIVPKEEKLNDTTQAISLGDSESIELVISEEDSSVVVENAFCTDSDPTSSKVDEAGNGETLSDKGSIRLMEDPGAKADQAEGGNRETVDEDEAHIGTKSEIVPLNDGREENTGSSGAFAEDAVLVNEMKETHQSTDEVEVAICDVEHTDRTQTNVSSFDLDTLNMNQNEDEKDFHDSTEAVLLENKKTELLIRGDELKVTLVDSEDHVTANVDENSLGGGHTKDESNANEKVEHPALGLAEAADTTKAAFMEMDANAEKVESPDTHDEKPSNADGDGDKRVLNDSILNQTQTNEQESKQIACQVTKQDNNGEGSDPCTEEPKNASDQSGSTASPLNMVEDVSQEVEKSCGEVLKQFGELNCNLEQEAKNTGNGDSHTSMAETDGVEGMDLNNGTEAVLVEEAEKSGVVLKEEEPAASKHEKGDQVGADSDSIPLNIAEALHQYGIRAFKSIEEGMNFAQGESTKTDTADARSRNVETEEHIKLSYIINTLGDKFKICQDEPPKSDTPETTREKEVSRQEENYAFSLAEVIKNRMMEGNEETKQPESAKPVAEVEKSEESEALSYIYERMELCNPQHESTCCVAQEGQIGDSLRAMERYLDFSPAVVDKVVEVDQNPTSEDDGTKVNGNAVITSAANQTVESPVVMLSEDMGHEALIKDEVRAISLVDGDNTAMMEAANLISDADRSNFLSPVARNEGTRIESTGSLATVESVEVEIEQVNLFPAVGDVEKPNATVSKETNPISGAAEMNDNSSNNDTLEKVVASGSDAKETNPISGAAEMNDNSSNNDTLEKVVASGSDAKETNPISGAAEMNDNSSNHDTLEKVVASGSDASEETKEISEGSAGITVDVANNDASEEVGVQESAFTMDEHTDDVLFHDAVERMNELECFDKDAEPEIKKTETQSN